MISRAAFAPVRGPDTAEVVAPAQPSRGADSIVVRIRLIGDTRGLEIVCGLI